MDRKSEQRRAKDSSLKKTTFFDIHCHAFTLAHPNFLAMIETLRERRLETIYTQITSFEYIASSFFHRGGLKLRNMLSVMENDPGDIFALMEDDLKGLYATETGESPLWDSSGLKISQMRFDRLVVTPLLIDFSQPGLHGKDMYYDRYPKKPIDAQISDVLSGIQSYRKKRPEGSLEIYPFLGINPKTHSKQSLEELMEKWFSGYIPGRKRRESAFLGMAKWKPGDDAQKFPPFAGVKLYPPLGFDPWPDEAPEREKVEYLYAFCERKRIPLTTHSDDGGFRILPLEEAWKFTSPRRYERALEKYPSLVLNFAHMGNQFSAPIGKFQQTEWRETIFDLMQKFENIYADFSFLGGVNGFYDSLSALLEKMPSARREIIEERLLFGSDFMVNLLKVKSYTEYLGLFSKSSLGEGIKRLFCVENPARFLFGDNE